jgi:hypothetical protein
VSVRAIHRQAFDSWLQLVEEERRLSNAIQACAEDSAEGQELRWQFLAAMNARIDAKNRFNQLSSDFIAEESERERLEQKRQVDEERKRRQLAIESAARARARRLTAKVVSPEIDQTPDQRLGPPVAPRESVVALARWRDAGSCVEETLPVVPISTFSEVPSTSHHVLTREIDRIAEYEFRDAPWRMRARQRWRGRRYEGFHRGMA